MPGPILTETPGLGQESLSSHLHREFLLQQRHLLCPQPRLLLSPGFYSFASSLALSSISNY